MLRLRDLPLLIGTLPTGPHNAITDVPGVRVGHTTIIEGETIRTGVTAIHPHEGDVFHEKVAANVLSVNGFGEVTGVSQLREMGVLESPILLTGSTHVGRVYDAVLQWNFARDPEMGISTWAPSPVVAECSDGWLSAVRGPYVQYAHVAAALDNATSGPVAEGGVGGGTGMTSFGFKGGIGTSSRVVDGYTVGVLVQNNFGQTPQLCMAGVPVGRELMTPPTNAAETSGSSIIIVVATDAPLDSRQLGRLAQRGSGGLARAGGLASTSSGDFVIAFSNTNRIPHQPSERVLGQRLVPESLRPGEHWPTAPAINALFQATLEATEEAIINSLCAAETMTGREGHTAEALPLDKVAEILQRYGSNVKQPVLSGLLRSEAAS